MPSIRYKGRRCEVYLPSAADLDRWHEFAKKSGTPLSKWIYENVELKLDQPDDTAKFNLIEDNSKLREEILRLKEELNLKNMLIERQKTELFKAEHARILESEFVGKLSEELIELLEQGGQWTGPDIMRSLGIDPRDSVATQILNRQLELLELVKLIKEGRRGWHWTQKRK